MSERLSAALRLARLTELVNEAAEETADRRVNNAVRVAVSHARNYANPASAHSCGDCRDAEERLHAALAEAFSRDGLAATLAEQLHEHRYGCIWRQEEAYGPQVHDDTLHRQDAERMVIALFPANP
jgi:hypothetical protein